MNDCKDNNAVVVSVAAEATEAVEAVEAEVAAAAAEAEVAAAAVAAEVAAELFWISYLSEPEVDELRESILINQAVLGLEVSVSDILAVHVAQGEDYPGGVELGLNVRYA